MDQEWTRRAHLIGLLSQQTDQDDGHVVTAQAAHLTVGGEAPEGREEGDRGIRGFCERLIFCQQQTNLLPDSVFAGGANVFKSHNYLDCQRGIHSI